MFSGILSSDSEPIVFERYVFPFVSSGTRLMMRSNRSTRGLRCNMPMRSCSRNCFQFRSSHYHEVFGGALLPMCWIHNETWLSGKLPCLCQKAIPRSCFGNVPPTL